MNRRRRAYFYNGTQDRPMLAPGGLISASTAQAWIEQGGQVLLPLYVSGTASVTSVAASTSILANCGSTDWTFALASNGTGLSLGAQNINSDTVNASWGTARQITGGTTTGSSSWSISSASTHFTSNAYVWYQQGTWTGTNFAASQMTHASDGSKRLMGGWLTRASSVNSTTLTVRDSLPYAVIEGAAAYNVSTLVCQSLTVQGIRFRNTAGATQGETGFGCLVVNFVDGLTINNCHFENSRVNGLAVQLCSRVTMNSVTADRIGPVGDVGGTGYSIQLRMVRDCTINNPTINNSRNGVQRDDGCVNLTINNPRGNATRLVRNHGGPDHNISIVGGGEAASDYQEGNGSWRIGARGPVTYTGVTGELLQVPARSSGTITWNGGAIGITQLFPQGNDANTAWQVSGNTPIAFTNVVASQNYEDVVRLSGTPAATVAFTATGCSFTCASSTHQPFDIQSSSGSSLAFNNCTIAYTSASNTSNGFIFAQNTGSASVSFTNCVLTKTGTNTAAAVSTVTGMNVTITAATGSTINGSAFGTTSAVSRG